MITKDRGIILKNKKEKLTLIIILLGHDPASFKALVEGLVQDLNSTKTEKLRHVNWSFRCRIFPLDLYLIEVV